MISFFVGWQLRNDEDNWGDFHMISQYIQWEDDENPGMYYAVTCNTGYMTNEAFSS